MMSFGSLRAHGPLLGGWLSVVLAVPALAARVGDGVAQPIRDILISAPVQGSIVDLKVQEGDQVKAGQPIIQLYVRLEELEMQRAKALVERREFEFKGSKRLYENKIISEAKAMEARIDLDLARIQYELSIEQVRLRSIQAPIDGTVVERRRDVGEAVSAAQPILRILDISKVIVPITARAEDLPNLRRGQKLNVYFPQLPGTDPRVGEVIYLDACADPVSGAIRVKVVVDNPDQVIKAGMRAVVKLPANALTVGLNTPNRTE
jgi:RND family efflux transporter MFP subunit